MSSPQRPTVPQRISTVTAVSDGGKSADLEKQPHASEESFQPLPISKGLFYYAICIILHTLLVVAHAVLVAHVWDGKPSHWLKGSWLTDGLYYIVVVAPNIVGKAILVGVLWLTQKLALRRNLHVPQTLTSVHDKSAAWLGLGTAVGALWNQLWRSDSERRAAQKFKTEGIPYVPKHDFSRLFGIVFIVIYLSGLFVLGLTMPLLLDIGFVYDNDERFVNITALLPSIGSNTLAVENDYSIVSIIPLLDNDIVAYGLHASYIFDVPNFNTGDQPIDVSAVQFHATCRALPQASFQTFNGNNGTFAFQIDPQVQPIHLMLTPRSISIAPLQLIDSSRPPPATMIVASTLDILDKTTTTTQSILYFTPAVIPVDCTQQLDCEQFAHLQILACDFNTTSLITQFDPILNELTHPDLLDNVAWDNWKVPGPPSDSTVSLVNVFGQLSPPSGKMVRYSIDDQNKTWTRNLTLLENELMVSLRYYNASVPLTDLDSLESALERAVASVLWRAALTRAYDTPPMDIANHSRYVIQISKYAPAVGLVVSFCLLVIAIFICWQPTPTWRIHSELSTPGVLQLTYLAGMDHTVPKKLVDALGKENPHTDELRAAGKKVGAWSFDGHAGPVARQRMAPSQSQT